MAYSQNDPAWKNVLLGFNTSHVFTIGTAGCYVTSIANVCRWAGHDLTPLQINDICKERGWFVDGGLISRDDIPALLCSNLGYVGRTNWTGPTDINFFHDASDPNVAYIIEIDASRAPGIQSHFVMVWSKPDASDLQIDDSWDGVRKALSHYGVPSATILSAMKFVKVAPPAPVVPVPPAVVPEPSSPPPASVAPPPPPPPPVAYIPAEKYKVVTTLLVFPSAQDAMQGTNAQTTLKPGSYYVYAKSGKAYNLTTNNMKDESKWINSIENRLADLPPSTRLDPPEMTANVANPLPPPENVQSMNWRGSINLGYAGMYVFYNHNKQHDESAMAVKIVDLETGSVIKQADNGQYSQFSGKVKWTDGHWYGRLKDTTGRFKWYAAPIEDLVPYNEFYGSKTTLQERQALHTLTATDKIEVWLAKIKTLGSNVWDVVRPK